MTRDLLEILVIGVAVCMALNIFFVSRRKLAASNPAAPTPIPSPDILPTIDAWLKAGGGVREISMTHRDYANPVVCRLWHLISDGSFSAEATGTDAQQAFEKALAKFAQRENGK
jgi:hypothetical protein